MDSFELVIVGGGLASARARSRPPASRAAAVGSCSSRATPRSPTTALRSPGATCAARQRRTTRSPEVYAAGDVANFLDPLYGRRRIEHWSNANYQGTEVGKVLAGTGGGYDTVSTFFTEIFGPVLKVFGDLGRHDELQVRGSLAERKLIGFYLRGGELLATLVVGQDEATENQLEELLRAKAHPVEAARLANTDVPLDEVFPAPAAP